MEVQIRLGAAGVPNRTVSDMVCLKVITCGARRRGTTGQRIAVGAGGLPGRKEIGIFGPDTGIQRIDQDPTRAVFACGAAHTENKTCKGNCIFEAERDVFTLRVVVPLRG